MKKLIVILCAFLGASCTKAKIKDTCENNSVNVCPENYNKDSATIFMTTAFTPNGDKLNDEFKAFIWGIEIANLNVYKGSKEIFSTTDISVGWDGTNEDGKMCKDGVYKYVITGSNVTDGDFEIKGEVSLITERKNRNCKCKYEDMLNPRSGFVHPSRDACDGD